MKKYNFLVAVFAVSCFFGTNLVMATGDGDNVGVLKGALDAIAGKLDVLSEAVKNLVNKKTENKEAEKKVVVPAKGTVATVFATIKGYVSDCPKECVKKTVMEGYTQWILNPLIINPIKNLLYPESRAEKIQKETDSIIKLSEQIDKLKKAGANGRYLSALKAQLAKKIQDSTINRDGRAGKK